MARYLAMRIIQGAYTYTYVLEKRPDLAPAVKAELIKEGYSHLAY